MAAPFPHDDLTDPFASKTTLSWVKETDPTAFAPISPNRNEATYSVTDDVSMRSSSVTSSRSNAVRVYVRLANGTRILVPISPDATIGGLHTEVTRRATRLGISANKNETVLETTGPNASILFEEDLLADVIDTTENSTLNLTSLSVSLTQLSVGASAPQQVPVRPGYLSPNPPSKNTVGSPSSAPHVINSKTVTTPKTRPKIYIRWITPRRALEAVYLQDVQTDTYSARDGMLVSDLKNMAHEKFCLKRGATDEYRPEGVQTEIYLSHCYISTVSGTSPAIADITSEGNTQNEPLNVFVSLVRSLKSPTKQHDSWGFECSDRSVATFMTALEAMMHEIKKKHINLDSLLDVLWRITHFPPVLISFKQLYDNTMPSSNNFRLSENRALAVLAECFREISRKMVPPWIANTPESTLEASRQIFAWLHTLSSQVAVSKDVLPLVHEFELRDVTSSSDQVVTHGRFKHDELVEVPMPNTATSQRRYLVSLMSLSHVSPKALAFALGGSDEGPYNYYFYLPSNTEQLLEHKRVSCLHPSDFDNLLETTNQVIGFRMVGPLQLASCVGSDLPVITLDSNGLVSTYNQRVELCGDGSYYTWNSIRGRETMSDTNPGQFLLHKLNPIMIQRKKDNNWEVDAWTETETANDMGNPEEAIVICVDTSSSMAHEMDLAWMVSGSSTADLSSPQSQFSRLTEVKDVFKNLVSRVSAYNLPTHLGLVTFSASTNIQTQQPLTPVLLNFQHKLDGVSSGGKTALFDAVSRAKDMLVALKTKHPKIKSRIIALTDGQDNDSRTGPSTVCRELYDADIVLDAIVIGTNSTVDLFKMATHTGGYAFCPKTRSALFQIFLLETFIDIKTRPEIVKLPIVNYTYSTPKRADMQTTFDFPPCRPHPNQSDDFISLRDADRFLTNLSKKTSNVTSSAASQISGSTWATEKTGLTGTTVGASGSSRLILNEIKLMIDNQHPYIDVYVSESNMGFWKVVMQGPPDSPYSNGTFLLYVELGAEFPRKSPSARFITPILHPNITKHGRICHPIFDREWTPTTRVHQVIEQLYGILMSLEARDAIDPLFTLKFWTDPESGRREVRQYVDRFAILNRASHKANILGSTNSIVPSPTASTRPPSYTSNPSSISAHGLASRISTLRRPVSVSSTGSAAPECTPPSTSSGVTSRQVTPRGSSRGSGGVGDTMETGEAEADGQDARPTTNSSTSSRRRRFFGRVQGRG